jgi:hypothetical protein
VDEQTDDTVTAKRPPWWLRPPAAFALVALLVLLNRWTGGSVVVPLAILVSASAFVVLGLAVFVPRFRARWFT